MREIIRCPHCRLNQFMTCNQNCRKCRLELIAKPVEVPVVIPPEPLSNFNRPVELGHMGIPALLVVLRHAFEMSQRDLARILNCPRTYISKLERGHSEPALRTLPRLAAPFGLSVQAF